MINANDTAKLNGKVLKGIYLMTDVLGNQRRVKVIPVEKSVLIKLLDNAPKLKTNDNYDEFIYGKGFVRLKYADSSPLYCWDDREFKLYPASGLEPLYFEFQQRI